jgi:hypothetical protein
MLHVNAHFKTRKSGQRRRHRAVAIAALEARAEPVHGEFQNAEEICDSPCTGVLASPLCVLTASETHSLRARASPRVQRDTSGASDHGSRGNGGRRCNRCNAARQPWQIWRPWQSNPCMLMNLKAYRETESLSLRPGLTQPAESRDKMLRRRTANHYLSRHKSAGIRDARSSSCEPPLSRKGSRLSTLSSLVALWGPRAADTSG